MAFADSSPQIGQRMFPFLIGKVLTMDGTWLKESFHRTFPFLIGKVLTRYELVSEITKLTHAFPFLIGKVLTIS